MGNCSERVRLSVLAGSRSDCLIVGRVHRTLGMIELLLPCG
jgi:hypothetical protein